MIDKSTRERSLFDEGVVPDFRVEIELSDPIYSAELKDRAHGWSRSGYSRHKAYLLSDGAYRRFSLKEEILYRINRMRFRDELSFNTENKGVSELVFTIGENSDWVFDETPFVFSKGKEIIDGIIRPGRPSEAIIRVIGDSRDFNAEITYSLRYRKGEDLKIHDPRIRNGQGVPFIPWDTDLNEELLKKFIGEHTSDDRDFMIRELIEVIF